MQWRSLRAPILARQGRLDEAVPLARSAVDLARASEAPILLAESLHELAAVLHQAGAATEACAAAGEAAAIYEAKGDAVSARRAQEVTQGET